MSAFEENEVSKGAQGGTEITKRKLAEAIDPELQEHFQIVPSRVRELKEDKIRIYWAHDLPGDPECDFFKDSARLDKFHKVIFSSQWQYQAFQFVYGLPYNRKCFVICTWVDPVLAPVKLSDKPQDVINIFYASTPHRGLELLVPVFEKLSETHPDLHLHVHSSFKMYGWDKQDEQFQPLYDRIKSLPNATYHGFDKDREGLLKKFNSYHILGYPAIWLETSCRVLMEAMTAGCLCVHPNYGALPETSGGLNLIFQGDMDDKNAHASMFYHELSHAVGLMKEPNQRQSLEDRLMFNKNYVDIRYNFDLIKQIWENLMRQLLIEYPTVESRKFPQPQFVYRV